MPSDRASASGPGPPLAPGLCARCRHAARQQSARGSSFWRCRRADTDSSFPRYPPLPVERCRGFDPGGAEELSSGS